MKQLPGDPYSLFPFINPEKKTIFPPFFVFLFPKRKTKNEKRVVFRFSFSYFQIEKRETGRFSILIFTPQNENRMAAKYTDPDHWLWLQFVFLYMFFLLLPLIILWSLFAVLFPSAAVSGLQRGVVYKQSIELHLSGPPNEAYFYLQHWNVSSHLQTA